MYTGKKASCILYYILGISMLFQMFIPTITVEMDMSREWYTVKRSTFSQPFISQDSPL